MIPGRAPLSRSMAQPVDQAGRGFRNVLHFPQLNRYGELVDRIGNDELSVTHRVLNPASLQSAANLTYVLFAVTREAHLKQLTVGGFLHANLVGRFLWPPAVIAADESDVLVEVVEHLRGGHAEIDTEQAMKSHEGNPPDR